MPSAAWIVLLAATAWSDSGAVAKRPELDEAVCCGHRRYAQALRLFEQARAAGEPAPADWYLRGFALMELHRPEEAAASLREASRLGFEGFNGWTPASALIKRAADARLASPPKDEKRSNAAIEVFAGPSTPWSGPVLDALPAFERTGRSLFGDRLPSLRFYMFKDRRSFDRFNRAVFTTPPAAAWQDGTGDLGIVVFTERASDAKKPRRAGDPESLAAVLHEFGHAWAVSYLMETRDADLFSDALNKPWLQEGLADYAAWTGDPEHLTRRRRWLKSCRAIEPMTLAGLSSPASFYKPEGSDQRYWVSALLVGRLLGPPETGAAKVRPLLDALALTGDPATAFREVCGKDPAKELEALLKELRAAP